LHTYVRTYTHLNISSKVAFLIHCSIFFIGLDFFDANANLEFKRQTSKHVIPSETGFTLVQKNSHVAKKLGSTFAQQQTGALKILQDFYFYFFAKELFAKNIVNQSSIC
jgi:hypothetical protein